VAGRELRFDGAHERDRVDRVLRAPRYKSALEPTISAYYGTSANSLKRAAAACFQQQHRALRKNRGTTRPRRGEVARQPGPRRASHALPYGAVLRLPRSLGSRSCGCRARACVRNATRATRRLDRQHSRGKRPAGSRIAADVRSRESRTPNTKDSATRFRFHDIGIHDRLLAECRRSSAQRSSIASYATTARKLWPAPVQATLPRVSSKPVTPIRSFRHSTHTVPSPLRCAAAAERSSPPLPAARRIDQLALNAIMLRALQQRRWTLTVRGAAGRSIASASTISRRHGTPSTRSNNEARRGTFRRLYRYGFFFRAVFAFFKRADLRPGFRGTAGVFFARVRFFGGVVAELPPRAKRRPPSGPKVWRNLRARLCRPSACECARTGKSSGYRRRLSASTARSNRSRTKTIRLVASALQRGDGAFVVNFGTIAPSIRAPKSSISEATASSCR